MVNATGYSNVDSKGGNWTLEKTAELTMFGTVWSDFGRNGTPTSPMKISICTIKLAPSDRTVGHAFLEHGRLKKGDCTQ